MLFMIMINMSEAYRNSNAPFFKKLYYSFGLDAYKASDILSMEEHFRKYPPRKKDRLSSKKSAHVLIRNIEVKRMWPDDFDEDDPMDLVGLNEGQKFPMFEIRDITMKRYSSWVAGDAIDFQRSQKKFGFNRDYFVKIPKTILQYYHDEDDGTLIIRDFDADFRPVKEKLKYRPLDLIPGYGFPEPEPV